MERHDSRVADIDARYAQRHAEADRGWDEVLGKVNALAQFKVAILSDGSPTYRVDERQGLAEIRAACLRYEALLKDERAKAAGNMADELAEHTKACWKNWVDLYIPAVEQMYSEADGTWAWQVIKDGGYKVDIEAVFAASHNAAIDAQIAGRQREVANARQEAHDSIEELRFAELMNEQAATQTELARIDGRRRRVAAALAGMGNSYSTAAPAQSAAGPFDPAPARAFEVNGPRSCSSDFACGIGFQCVKPNFSSDGTCMRSVNSFGVQQFNMPRTDSVAPKVPSPMDCNYGRMCPPGFRCDFNSGVCIR